MWNGKEHLGGGTLLRQPFVFGPFVDRRWVNVLLSGACTCLNFFVRPSWALLRSVPFMQARMSKRVAYSSKG